MTAEDDEAHIRARLAEARRSGLAQGNRDALRVLCRTLGPLTVPWRYLMDGPTGSVRDRADEDGVTYWWRPDPRDVPHDAETAGEAGRMDSPTIVARLRSLADFLDGANFAVSWLYLDPTPDGPGEARTVHTLEMDGAYAGEVFGNLAALIAGFSDLEHISAEATAGRVAFEAVGGTPDGQTIRGTAIILDPYATALMALLDLTPVVDGSAPSTRGDLTYAQITALASDPQMAAGVTPSAPPAVDVPPLPDPNQTPGSDPSSTTPPPDTAVPTPSPTDSTSDPSTPDPSTPIPSPTTDTPSAPSDSSSTGSPLDPSQPSAPSTPPAGDTSATAGGAAPTDSGSGGGLVVGGNSDAPSQPAPSAPSSASPSPDPTSTAVDGGGTPAPVATGQQPGTPDGTLTNPDGTPVEPTAGTTADVGSASAGTPGATSDPTLPGQTPVAVSDQPLPSGADPSASSSTADPSATPAPGASSPTGSDASSTAASSGPSADPGEDFDDELAALQAQMDAIRARKQGGQPAGDGGQHEAPDAGQPAQAAANVDPVPDGGQNLASGQGAGAVSAAPESGDGSTDAPSPGPSTTTDDTANPDGF